MRSLFGEKVGGIAGDGRVERSGFLEIRNQFAERARVHDGARKLMRADFAGFFENIDILRRKRRRFVRLRVPFDQIREMQRARKARGSGTDDQHIRFQALALDWHFVILAEGRMSALWGSPRASLRLCVSDVNEQRRSRSIRLIV